MAICCTICGQWYPQVGRDTLDICPDCYTQNFEGSQELLLDAPSARDVLEASVRSIDSSRQLTLTPRQVQAMRRLHARWAARSEAARAREEEGA